MNRGGGGGGRRGVCGERGEVKRATLVPPSFSPPRQKRFQTVFACRKTRVLHKKSLFRKIRSYLQVITILQQFCHKVASCCEICYDFFKKTCRISSRVTREPKKVTPPHTYPKHHTLPIPATGAISKSHWRQPLRAEWQQSSKGILIFRFFNADDDDTPFPLKKSVSRAVIRNSSLLCEEAWKFVPQQARRDCAQKTNLPLLFFFARIHFTSTPKEAEEGKS